MAQSASAQTGSAAATPAVSSQDVTLQDGTELSVSLVEALSSKTAAEGDPVVMRTEEATNVSGHEAIAKGTLVKGTVSSVQHKGRMGKSGSIGIRVESTTAVDGKKVRLRATRGGEGEGKVGTTVVLTAIFGPLGLLKSGKDAELKAGTIIKAFTDETVVIATTTPTPSHN